MKVNYHTHTTRCRHASGKDIEYFEQAIANDLDILGMSDHIPYPDYDYGCRMFYDQLDEYLDTMTRYKEELSSQIKVLCGLESEFLPKYSKYYEQLLNDKRIDYLLLGEHFFDDGNGGRDSAFHSYSTESFIRYAECIIEAMNTGLFSMLVHPDLIFINDYAWDKNCDIACDMILNAAVKNDWILEYNANGLRRGLTEFCDGSRYPYPIEDFWKKVADAKIRTIVGSDAHDPSQVWDDSVRTAIENVNSLGINTVLEIL